MFSSKKSVNFFGTCSKVAMGRRSTLAAPVKEQPHRRFDPLLVFCDRVTPGEQSQALGYANNKDEELLGSNLEIVELDHPATRVALEDIAYFSYNPAAIALDKKLRKSWESGGFGNEEAMKGKHFGLKRDVQEPFPKAAEPFLDIIRRWLNLVQDPDLMVEISLERADE